MRVGVSKSKIGKVADNRTEEKIHNVGDKKYDDKDK